MNRQIFNPLNCKEKKISTLSEIRNFNFFYFCIGWFVFFLTPLNFFLTDPLLFQQSFLKSLLNILIALFVSYILCMCLFLCVMRISQSLSRMLLVWVSIIFIYYIAFDNVSYGPVQSFRFRDQQLFDNINIVKDCIVFVSAGIISCLTVRRWKTDTFFIYIIFVLLVSVNFGVRLVELYRGGVGYFAKKQVAGFKPDLSETNAKPSQFKIRLSKSGMNVILILLDSFRGESPGILLRGGDEPLGASFKDFTWYPDTLSVGRATVSGELAILSGVKASPAWVNTFRGETIGDMWRSAYGTYFGALQQKTFLTNIVPDIYTDGCAEIQKITPLRNLLCEDGQSLKDSYFASYYKTRPQLASDVSVEDKKPALLGKVPLFGLFYALPHTFKKLLYQGPIWAFVFAGHTLSESEIKDAYKEYLTFSGVLESAEVLGEFDGSFTYVRSNVSHDPWVLDKNCNRAASGFVGLAEYGPGNSERCALKAIASFLDLLKAKGVYDNSLVVLASDHSSDESMFLGERVGFEKVRGLNAQALLMIKDPGVTSSALSVSTALMSNSDVPRIVCEYLGTCSGILSDPRKQPDSHRVRFVASHPSHVTYQGTDHFKIDRLYRVEGSMFEAENWRLVDLDNIHDIRDDLLREFGGDSHGP